MHMANKIVIPKKIKFKDRKITVVMKSKIEGICMINDDGKSRYFHSSYPYINIPISHDSRIEIVQEIKEKILDVYDRGIKDIKNLESYELFIFYCIKEVKNDKDPEAFIIGYEDNNILNIKNTLLKIDIESDYIELPKNIELYINREEYDKIYNKIKRKINKKNYNKFIIDITNIYFQSNYEKTKKIVNLVESTGGKILFLLDRTDASSDRFLRIFGEHYSESFVDKSKYFSQYSNFSLYKIEKILLD